MQPGDEFRDFVLARYSSYLRTAYLLTGDWGHAEDLVQTSLTKVYRAWDRLGDRGNLDAYVQRVLVNTHSSAWRRAWRKETPTGELPDWSGPDESDHVAQRDRIRRALRELPPRQRAAVVLRHYEDLSEADTAHVLGCTLGTVKSLTSRGLTKLREVLEADAPYAELVPASAITGGVR